ncbi:MAG: DUF2203 family protein [Planctomycetaceae bacterium]
MTVSSVTGKTFTREEANRTLPLVRLIVRDIVDLHADLRSRRERLDDLSGGRRRKPRENDPYAEELRQMEADFAADEQSLHGLVAELGELGVQIGDAATGAVTFPGHGQTQFRWRLGDADVHADAPDNTLNLYTPPKFDDRDDLLPDSQ